MVKNPGWVDIQVNGHLGIDFSDPQLTEADFLRVSEALLASGTAVFLPTICTATTELFRRNSKLIHDAVVRHGLEKSIPGLHFEGPCISSCPGAVGAHKAEWVREPTPECVAELIDASAGFLRLLTLAAEYPRAAEAIEFARSRGIRVALGHQLAGPDDLRRAAAAGAEMLTHLGNGVPNTLDRHHNPIVAGLAEDALGAMIITDGHHIPPELIKVVFRCKGAGKVIVTSDASRVTGLPPGAYPGIGNPEAVLEPSGRYFNPVKKCLVGSAVTILQCMEYLAGLGLLDDRELELVGRTNALTWLGLDFV